MRYTKRRYWWENDALANLIAIIVIVILLGFMGFLTQVAAGWQCAEQWKDSGYRTRYEFASGCQIKMPDGRWIPANSYKEVK